MDLRQLNTFLVVAELGSLSRAADRLRIAQPALSRQIHQLEEELKTALFIRHGRGMVLTETGKKLRIRAGGILRQVDETKKDLLGEAGVVRGQVIIGIPPTVSCILASRLVERYLSHYPEVTLRVVQAFSGHLLEWLQHGEIDIAVVYSGHEFGDIRFSPLLTEQLYFIPPATGARLSQKTITLADIAHHPLALPGPQQGLRQLIESAAHAQGTPLSIAVEVDDFQLTKDLALKGLYGTILPLAAIQPEITARRLQALMIDTPPLSRQLAIARPRGRRNSHAARLFCELIQQEVQDMIAGGLWDGARTI